MMKIAALLVSLVFGFVGSAQTLPSPDAPPSSTVTAPAHAPQDPSSARAHAILDQMVKALGGQWWLNLRNRYVRGRIAAFYQGKPTGATINYWEWSTPTEERIDLNESASDKHNWVQVFTGNQCWELTYRGKRAIAKDVCSAAIRRREHSIDAAVHVWMKQPDTIFMYEGQTLAERHLTDQVTLLNANNDALTIQVDAETHLPRALTWSWRDPVYHDKDQDTEEYDDYHTIDGIPTPFSITQVHNGDTAQQRFVLKAAYNVELPPDGFDADAIVAKIHK